MKFFGMVAMLALVSTVAFADDHAAPAHDAAAKVDAAADTAGKKMDEGKKGMHKAHAKVKAKMEMGKAKAEKAAADAPAEAPAKAN